MLSSVTGGKSEFETKLRQVSWPEPYQCRKDKQKGIEIDIEKRIAKGVIQRVSSPEDAYVSNICTREKQDGSPRVILDFKNLNKNIIYHHFKMDSSQTATDLMKTDCYMATIDWKDAYNCLPVGQCDRKFLAFQWKNQIYQYTCLTNGLASAPRTFTKISKVLFSQLRKKRTCKHGLHRRFPVDS